MSDLALEKQKMPLRNRLKNTILQVPNPKMSFDEKRDTYF